MTQIDLEKLKQFLKNRFSSEELDSFLRTRDDLRELEHAAAKGVPYDHRISELVHALERRGLVDHGLLVTLKEARPRYSRELDEMFLVGPGHRFPAHRNVLVDVPLPTDILPLIDMSGEDWIWLLRKIRLLSTSCKLSTRKGEAWDEVDHKEPDGGHAGVVWCSDAPGRLISDNDIQRANLLMDIQQLTALTLVAFGRMMDDAALVWNKLRERKPLFVIDRSTVVDLLVASGSEGLHETLRKASASHAETSLFVAREQWGILVVQKANPPSMHLVDAAGETLSAVDPLVKILRERREDLQTIPYLEGENPPLPGGDGDGDGFEGRLDRYRQACFDRYQEIQYDALALLGFRHQKLPLLKIFVDSMAESAGEDQLSEAMLQAIEDNLGSLKMTETARARLEEQLKARLGGGHSAAKGYVRAMFRRHGRVALTGDPGSGKTCFVKRELLDHCKPPQDDDWYRYHIPLYLSLAEAAQELERRQCGAEEPVDLLLMSVELARRSGLSIPTLGC